MRKQSLYPLVLSAMFIAIGLILPFFTGNIRTIGNMLLPMHLPVMLCGLVCGKYYGAGVGAILPILRSLAFSMPVFFPSAVAMAFELAAYGFIIGLVYGFFRRKTLGAVYVSLISSMVAGRLIWGAVMTLLLGLSGSRFTLILFWTNGFVNAVPGLILQLILIPSLILIINKTKIISR